MRMTSRLLNNSRYSLIRMCVRRHSSTGHFSNGGVTDGLSKLDSELPKAYEPTVFEEAWIERWNARKSLDRTDSSTFRMIFPPPNVTGKLHLGHALTLAVEDTIARWKIMQGYKLEWIPGFDHAGIATHTVALRKLRPEEATDAQDLRNKIEEFASDNLEHIKKQLQSMGGLLDWESAYYTLDKNHSTVVKEAFMHLFEAGLIQRGDGMVNWSCALKSSISDVEVDHVDFKGKMTLRVPGHKQPIEFGVLHYCAYQLENSDECLIVATSRPETMFGDVALAVNPGDSRYNRFVGRNVINPVNDKLLPVIQDSRVKTDFGSGVVKITPAHDKLDFAIGLSHKLPRLEIISNDGFLTLQAGSCKTTIPRLDARKVVLENLSRSGALKHSKEYSGSLNLCSRTGDLIEMKVLPHWFLKTAKLTQQFVDAINSKEFIISPDHQSKDLLNMLSESQDWCLSRQINWGHTIPMYHHVNHPEQWVSASSLSSAKKKIVDKYGIKIESDSEILQDTDVLDTWFSSALIPVALSGWPDLKDVRTISLMETGYDILLYWVWRMVITTLALTGQFPFNHVLLHGIVSDKYGRKMSKSKGNVIDPMHVINGISHAGLFDEAKQALDNGELVSNEYNLRISAIESDYPEGFKAFGRDALRIALLSQDIQAQQLNLDITYLENCRHFTNKLWQALRFFMLYKSVLKDTASIAKPATLSLHSVADLWLLSCLHEFAVNTENYLDNGTFHLYAESIRKFFYQQLCDVYIELIKHDVKTGKNIDEHLLVMQYAISVGLKLSHPIIPFVTEEIWTRLGQDGLLIDQSFPKAEELKLFDNPKLNSVVLKTMKLVKEIRSLKTRIGMKAKSSPQMFLDISPSELPDIGLMKLHIENLAGCCLTCDSPPTRDKSNFITVIFQLDGKICKISTPKGDATTKYLEVERNKITKLQTKLAKLKQQYENPNFQQYASFEVKEKLRKRLETLETQINEVTTGSPTENTQNP